MKHRNQEPVPQPKSEHPDTMSDRVLTWTDLDTGQIEQARYSHAEAGECPIASYPHTVSPTVFCHSCSYCHVGPACK